MKDSKRRSLKKYNSRINKIEKRLNYLQRREAGNICQPDKQKGRSPNDKKTWFNRSLNFMYRRNFFHENHEPISQVEVKIPENFSITNNYDESIGFLRKFLEYGMDRRVNHIHIDHTSCNKLGLSASSIMDEFSSLIYGYRKYKHYPFEFSGKMPQKSPVSDMLIVSGLIKRLNVSYSAALSSTVIPLPYSKNAPSDIGQTQVINFLNNCLGKHGYSLSRKSRQIVGEMLGEIIDNCELHCGTEVNNHNIIGHYRDIPETNCGECSISIYNFGDTIYETFKKLGSESSMIQELNAITQRHTRFFWTKWDEETLWTLYALQEGVSSKRSDDDPGRGSGTITFLNLLTCLKSSVCNLAPKMCITSGHTQIIIDGTYEIEYNENRRKIIAFNENNDIFKVPDSNFVFASKEYFPGTIISMKFYIDDEYLEKSTEENENETV